MRSGSFLPIVTVIFCYLFDKYGFEYFLGESVTPLYGM